MRSSSFKALNGRCEVVACLERLELCHRLARGVLVERGAVAPVLHEQHAVFLGKRPVVVVLHAALFGEDGGALSAGQKQLLCITRIMLCLPPMLILDEATSSIDTRTDMRIQNAFAKLMRGRTSFIVAHRLSTIREADVILVMRDGNIIEQGTHDDLLKKGGFYAELWNAQFAV